MSTKELQAPALHDLSVAELARRLRVKELSAVEAATHFLGRIEAHGDLGAFLATDREATLAQAREADRRLAAGDAAPLLGVPIAHKDIFVTRDFPTTAGSKMLAGYRSPFDATVVARLAGAGAVNLGKLNCDEFAMGSANENSAYGPARNPWDTSRIPGGSSGGAAAASPGVIRPIRVCSRIRGLIGFTSRSDRPKPRRRSRSAVENCPMEL